MTWERDPFAELVEACGCTAEELAESSGVPTESIRRFMSGRGRPSRANARRLATAMRLKPSDVLHPAEWLRRGRSHFDPVRRAYVEQAYQVPPTRAPKWGEAAPCRHADPELFWPTMGEYPTEAMVLCARCPVLGDCRELFLSQRHDEGGVWFGTTHSERRIWRREQRGARRGAA